MPKVKGQEMQRLKFLLFLPKNNPLRSQKEKLLTRALVTTMAKETWKAPMMQTTMQTWVPRITSR